MEDVVKKVTPENYHEMTFEPIETPSVEPNNVDAPQVSEPELKTTEELPEGDKPKEIFDETAKHFQSIADKRLAELTKAQLETERLKAELDAVKSPKPEAKPLEEPIEPVMPPDYDALDAVTKGTTSHEYDKAFKQYLKDVAKYNMVLGKELRQEKEKYERINQQSQIKAQILGEYTSRGKTVTEAEAIHNFTTELLSPEGFTPERIMAFFEFEKKNNPQNQLKNSQMDSRKEKQQFVTPPGVVPSPTDKSKSADDMFDEQIKVPKRGWL